MQKHVKYHQVVTELSVTPRQFFCANDLATHFWHVAQAYVVREDAGGNRSPVHYLARRKLLENALEGRGPRKVFFQRNLKKYLQWEYVIGYRFTAIRQVNEKTIKSW